MDRPKSKTEVRELTHKLLKERQVNKPGAESKNMLKDFESKNQRERITLRSR